MNQHGLRACEGCGQRYVGRPPGDMADLNHLCRGCAEECAAELERLYGLRPDCTDEQRQAGIKNYEAWTRGSNERYDFSPDPPRMRGW